MSRTIDERVVEMQFQNESFERNANQSISTLGKLDSALELKNGKKSFADVEAAAKKTNFSSLMNAVEQVSSKFTALGVIGFTALQRIANAAINVGTQLVKSLTIDPIMQGYQEYELKMGSIQTIMAGTGEDLQTVNGYLEELNEYADRTIYSFADMTQNIGKFTNNGVSLENSVAAIQGIANVAAISGANANEASRAMYNLAQALSAGYVKLIDWKSIENANMGTVEFKQNLIDTAVELGTVTKKADGMYRTLSGKTFNATQNFNDVLQEQWMTSDVLINTLIRYTDETTELGQQAYEAATKVRTFSKLMDTLKEAVGSGWAMTAQYIIGDFEQASDLWTKVNDKLSGIINKSAEARNSLLKVWNQGMVDDEGNAIRMWNTVDKVWTNLTGREAVLQGLTAIFHNMERILGRVSNAFGKVFKQLNAQDLIQASYKFLDLARSLRLSGKQLDSLESGFTGIFSAIKKAWSVAKTFIGSLKPLTRLVSCIGNDAIKAFGKLGEKLSEITKGDGYKSFFSSFESGLDTVVTKLINAADAAKEFFGGLLEGIKLPSLSDFFAQFDGVSSISSGLSSAAASISGWFSSLGGDFTNLFSNFSLEELGSSIGSFISNLFSGLGSGFSNAFSGFSLDNLTSLIGTGGLTALLASLTGFVNTFKESLDSLSGVVGEGGVLGTLRDTLKSFQTQIKAKAIKDIAISVGILATALLVLSMIKPERLGVALFALAGALVGLVKTVSAIGKIVSGMGFNLKGFIALASALIPLAVAILVLSAAVKSMAELSWGELLTGLAGLAGVSYTLAKTAGYLAKSANGLKISAVGYIGLATAVLILSVAVKKFAELDLGKMAQGLIGVAAVLASVAGFTKLAETAKIGVSTGVGLIAMAAAMIIFASAVEKFGEMPWQQALQGVIAMAAVLAAIAGFSALVEQFGSGNMISLGASLILIGASMHILASALGKFGGMPLAEIGKGLLAMAGSLGILAAAMRAFAKAKDGTVAMLAASAAILIITPALKSLGQLSLKQVGISLLVLAGAFTVLGVAGLLLKPLAPTIQVLSGALALMGVGVLAAGVGITALAAGIITLATAFAGGATAIVNAMVAIATGLAQGFVQFIATLGQAGAQISVSVAQIVLSILSALRTIIPGVLQLGLELLLSLLIIIAAYAEPLATAAVNVITAIGKAITGAADELTNAAIELALAFINGLADGIRENQEAIFSAIRNLISSIIELCISAIQELLSMIPGGDKIAEKLEGAKTAVRDFLAPETVEGVGTDAGNTVGENVSEGVTDSIDVSDTGTVIAGQLESATADLDLSSVSGNVSSLLSSSMSENLDLSSLTTSLPETFTTALSGVDMSATGAQLGTSVTDSINLGITGSGSAYKLQQSGTSAAGNVDTGFKSVDFSPTGANVCDGIVQGINASSGRVMAAAAALAQQAAATINAALQINSPSKVTEKSGSGIVEGLALGITENTGLALSSAELMAAKTVNALNTSLDDTEVAAVTPVLDMSAIYAQIDGMDDDGEWQMVIKPVLDMSGANPGLKNLNAIVSAKAQTAADSAIQNGSANSVQTIWSPTFNQYNSSPKALSRTEIYRQTKNQFSALKGVMSR